MARRRVITYREYDDMLDEVYGSFKIGYVKFDASLILKELDGIAYRQGYLDYVDSEDGLTEDDEDDEEEDEDDEEGDG